MLKSQRSFYFIFVTVASWIFLNFFQASFALEVETHKAINRYIAQQSINKFSLNTYLKDQLGMKEGTETYFKSDFMDQQIFKWIGEGGEVEDQGIRVKNHFHNPITNKGLGVGVSAFTWATLPIGGQDLGPISSWYDVRDYYLKALTSADKAARENWFARTFQGVGQIMHLVKDMSVPAHVRDDKHIKLLGFGGDNYENWMDRPENRNAITNFQVVSFAPDTLYPLNIKNLFDTDRYLEGTDPTITTSSNSIGLSEYTNANFFSGDTINAANFPYPKTDNNKKITKPYTGKEATYNREYFIKDCNDPYCQNSDTKNYNGYLLSAVDLNDYWRMQNPNSSNPKRIIPVLDENVHYDYAQLLIPRAIGYSSQVLKYFFRGQLDVTLGDGNIKIKNASDETISGGKFRLYYDNSDGVRTPLTDPVDANTLEKGSGEQMIAFNKPEGAKSYMLVYEGPLGAEPNAVIGKYIPTDSSYVVFLFGSYTKPQRVVVVYDPYTETIKFSARSSTDAEYQAWLAGTSLDSESSPMFNLSDVNYQDTAPYTIDPDLVDVPQFSYAERTPAGWNGHWTVLNNYKHYHDDCGVAGDSYRKYLFPQTRSVGCIGSTYKTGFRTERILYENTIHHYLHCSCQSGPEMSEEVWISKDVPLIEPTIQNINLAAIEFRAAFPYPIWAFQNCYSWFHELWTERIYLYGEFGVVGDYIEKILTVNYFGDGPDEFVGPFEVVYPQFVEVIDEGNCVYIINGVKNLNAFSTILLFIVRKRRWEPYFYTNLDREVRIQAAGELFNGQEWYNKSPKAILETELTAAVNLFHTINGLGSTDIDKNISVNVTMRK